MEEKNEIRMRIRELCYKQLGKTDNVIELFILNRFPESHVDYWAEWIERLRNPSSMGYMDKESSTVYLSVLKKLFKLDITIPNEVNIFGGYE